MEAPGAAQAGPAAENMAATNKATQGCCGEGYAGGAAATVFNKMLNSDEVMVALFYHPGAYKVLHEIYAHANDEYATHRNLAREKSIIQGLGEVGVDPIKDAQREQYRKWALASLDSSDDSTADRFIYLEWYALLNGENKSLSYEHYEKLQEEDRRVDAPSDFQQIKNRIGMAISLGLDMLVSDKVYAQGTGQLPTNVIAPTAKPPSDQKLRALNMNKIGRDGPKSSMKQLNMGLAAAGFALAGIMKGQSFFNELVGRPLPRGLLLQTVAILAIVNHGISKKNYDIVKRNQKFIEHLLNNFKVTDGQTVDNYSDPTPIAVEDRAIDDVDQDVISVPVARSPEIQLDVDTKGACPRGFVRVKKSDKCTTEKLSGLSKKFDSKAIGLGATLTGALRSIDSLRSAQALGNVQAANLASKNLLEKAGAINGRVGQLRRKINELRKKDGLKEIDFNKKEDEILGDLNGITAAAIGKEDLARLQNGNSLNDISRNNQSIARFLEEEDEKDKDKKSKVDPIAAKIKTAYTKGKGGGKKVRRRRRKRDKGFLNGITDEGFLNGKVGPSAAPAALQSQALNQYQDNANDINKNAGMGIFEIISNRYLRSAVPAFLSKKKKKGRTKASK